MGLETNKIKYKKEWPLVQLKEICNRISDGVHFKPEYVNKGIPFISVKDIYDESVHFDKCKYITVALHKELIKRCHPEKDDILITKSGTIGRMALVPEKPEFSLFVSVALIKNKKEIIHSKFLKLCLENFINSINISQDIKGGLLKNFHLEDIRQVLVPLVSLSEQENIVSKIEELFSELDKGIENLRLAQQQLKTYRQSVLKYAFEGKLTNDDVKEGELPKGWNVKFLKDVCKINGGVTKGKDYKGKNTVHLPYLRVANVQDGYLNLNEIKTIEILADEKEKYELLYGDILYTEGGDKDKLGRGTIWKNEIDDCTHQNHIFRARPLSTDINSEYISYFSQTRNAKKYFFINGKQTTNLASINLTILSNLSIPICSLEEQKAIVQAIESRLSIADKMEESIIQSLQQAEVLRQSILKRGFEGTLI